MPFSPKTLEEIGPDRWAEEMIPMRRELSRLSALVCVLAVWAAVPCAAQQAAASPVAPASPLEAASSQLKAGNYAEALKTAEEAIPKDPRPFELQVVKVDALMGLRRYQEAGNQAWLLANQHPERPELRLKAGLSAYRCGAYPPSAKAWALLTQVPGWAPHGYHLGIQCALSLGDKLTARDILKEGLAKVTPPSQEMMDDMLQIENDPKVCLPALDAYLKSSPKDAAFYVAQRALYAAAGDGQLFQCDAAPQGPIQIPLQEKSEQLSIPVTTTTSSDQVSGWNDMQTSTSVVLPVAINGGSTQWPILDSGSAFMMVSQETAQQLKLQPVSAGQYAGMSGESASTDWVLLQKVQIGPLTFYNVPAMLVAKKSDFRAKRGVVPLSLFRDWAVHYDRRHSKLELLPSGTDPEQVMGKGTFKVRSLWFWGKPYVYARIKETGGLPCQLDTGAFATSVAAEHAAEAGVRPNTGKYNNQTVLGATGVVSTGVAEKVQVSIGIANFNLNTVQVLPLNMDRELTPVYGNVGREILDLFEIFFDYPKNTVAFKAYK